MLNLGLLRSQKPVHCVRINRGVLSFGFHFFEVLDAVIHFLFLAQIDGRQKILNHVVVPIVDLPVSNLFLCVVSHVLDVQSRAALKVSKSDLVKFLSKGLLGVAFTHLRNMASNSLELSALLLFVRGVPG